MKRVAIVQARMGSTRLPGKVMLPLGNDSVLAAVIGRLRRAARLDEVWIATTTAEDDAAIVAEAARLGAPCFRGDAQDVLARYHGAAAAAGADIVLRVTSDCPLIDPGVVGEVIARFGEGEDYDYMTIGLVRTYPRGLDTEIMTRAALDRAFAEARAPEEREHVTPYLYRNPQLFRLGEQRGTPDLSAHRWTLDTPEDYRMLTALVGLLGADWMRADYRHIAAVLDAHPEVFGINQTIRQKTLGE